MEIMILVGLFAIFIIVTSKISKKKQDEQRKTLEESMVPGAWVQTIGGFCGKLVEIDGDVVILQTPTGEESLWLRKAIARVEEPPFAIDEEIEAEFTEKTSKEESLESKSEEEKSEDVKSENAEQIEKETDLTKEEKNSFEETKITDKDTEKLEEKK